ncbi:MAG: peptidase S14, partial [Clostridia bacterium]|nr:peptidase S14 [Clostridia bacterium]
FVSGHSRRSAVRLRSLMLNTDEIATDMGSVLDGRMAVDEGLVDAIGGLSDALEYLRGRAGR